MAPAILAFDATGAAAATPQTIHFTSATPLEATVGGLQYNVTATGGASNEPVVFTIDPASASVCTLSGSSGSSVSFTGVGICTIDANQAGNTEYEPAPQEHQSFAVKYAQSIAFTSTRPTSATAGGATYTVSAAASSGLPVIFSIDFSSNYVCSISGSTVRFTAAGTCTIDADQQGNEAEYWQAPEVQQSLTVAKAPESSGDTTEYSSGSAFIVPTPLSETFTGPVAGQGNQAEPSNVVRVVAERPNKRSGGVALIVAVPGPGVLSARDSVSARAKHPKHKGSPALIKPVRANPKRAGRVTLQISPTKAGAIRLKGKHRLSVKVLIAFTPDGGTAGAIVKTVVLT